MWFDEAGEVVEMFKGSFPYSFLFFVPIFIIISPVSPAAAASEFTVFRMQQYDMQGTSYGCHSGIVNVEARAIDTTVYTRRCVLARLREVTMDKFKDMVSQNAAALLVLLPKDLESLEQQDKEHLMELEQDFLQEESQMPVYFTQETDPVTEIYEGVSSSVNSDQAGSAAEALLSSASANGYQMLVSGAASKALNEFQVVNLQGKLAGFGIEEQLPTLAIVAHYDSYGIAPSLSTGADSNASGIVALLELARLFSKLYTNSRTHAKFNILFLLSGAGKFNYQGTRKWIEDQLDSTEASLLADVSHVLCLDALGSGDGMYLHVSKPPKEGSAGDNIAKSIESALNELRPGTEFQLIHKKINLAEDVLAWEHERFSMRRLPALTVSHFPSHKAHVRHSILDTRDSVSSSTLALNIQVLAEAMARHIFNLSSASSSPAEGSGSLEIFNEGLQVEVEVVEAWLDYLTSQSRAAQLLPHDSPLINALEHALGRHLKDVKRHVVTADKRDPEFVFYSGAEYTMNAYNVKPAVFDLFLALGIAAYLGVIYVAVQNLNIVYSTLRALTGNNNNNHTKAKRQ